MRLNLWSQMIFPVKIKIRINKRFFFSKKKKKNPAQVQVNHCQTDKFKSVIEIK